jgi:hypothetical protein
MVRERAIFLVSSFKNKSELSGKRVGLHQKAPILILIKIE